MEFIGASVEYAVPTTVLGVAIMAMSFCGYVGVAVGSVFVAGILRHLYKTLRGMPTTSAGRSEFHHAAQADQPPVEQPKLESGPQKLHPSDASASTALTDADSDTDALVESREQLLSTLLTASATPKSALAQVSALSRALARGSKTKPSPLNVLTYNTYCLPYNFLPKRLCRDQDQRLPLIAKRLEGFNLMLLQECFRGHFQQSRVNNFIRTLRTEYGMNVVASQPPGMEDVLSGVFASSGLVVAATGAITRHEFRPYESKCILGDNIAAKGVMYALVYPENSHQGLHVFNTHLQSDHNEKEYPSCRSIRMRQLAELVEFARAQIALHPQFPIILGGDMNVNANSNAVIPASSDRNAAGSKDYEDMLQILSGLTGHRPRDLLYDHFNSHPSTHLDTSAEPREEHLFFPADWEDFNVGARLDYIFLWPPRDERFVVGSEIASPQAGARSRHDFQSMDIPVTVEKFLHVPDDAFTGTQLSDHYGVSARIPLISEEDFDVTANQLRG
jgi:endonuclease/exonuclease/phosphatase family metal-dependent hydrolase